MKKIKINGKEVPLGESREGGNNPVLCPVCGKFAFAEDGNYDVCPFCAWENDPVQYDYPDAWGGANKPSLNEAKENYKKFGAKDQESLPFVQAFQEQMARGFVPHNGTMYMHIQEFIEDADPVEMIKKMSKGGTE